MKSLKHPQNGFALAEVVVAVLIMSLCMIPILLLFFSTRSNTSSAIFRLRAMELINEASDWVTVCPFNKQEPLAAFASGDIIPIPVNEGKNICLKPFIYAGKAGETYASQYGGNIRRDVKVKAAGSGPSPMKDVEITVSWSEAGKKHHSEMAVLVIDEDFPDY